MTKSHDDKRSATWICFSLILAMMLWASKKQKCWIQPWYIVMIKAIWSLEKTSVPDRPKYIEIKHYILHDEVQKREVVLQYIYIYISTDEQKNKHFGKTSVQDERVCVIKLELVETTSLLKKEDMTPRLGGSTDMYWSMDSHFSVQKMVQDEHILWSLESGLRFLMDIHFPVHKMVQIVDLP